MVARFHYDHDTLTRFLDTDIDAKPTDETAEIAAHVEDCADCQSQLESLFDEGLTMQKAGDLLKESERWAQADADAEADANATPRFIKLLEPSDYPESMGRFARYEIMQLLGRGGMGIVFRGFDTSLNRYSAIKVLAPELATSGAARKRFSREARSAAAVVHPHVVPIQTVDQHDGLPYLVMPVVEGRSVEGRVQESGPLSVIEAVRIAAQVADGLSAAHQQGLVHRDIKPANVLLENGVERVQITDFGLARAIDDASMTRSGVIAGTPQYMSPEQAHGDSIDHRSDLFSLGSLIYFMLTGRSPFRAETTMGVLNRIGNDDPRSIRSINADVPEWLEQFVMRLLAKSPDDRYQTASEVAELLQTWHAHLQQPDIAERPSDIVVDRSANPTRDRGVIHDNNRSLVAKYGEPAASAVGSLNGLASGGGSGIRHVLVALAAFGFFAFAGVVIVLELDKGRLTIESEADDIPIRIMQGDEVVRELTVTKSGTSVRVASGKYVVLIDGEFSDIHVDSGTVTLGRRENKTVRIVQIDEQTEASANAIEATGPQDSARILTPEQAMEHGYLQFLAAEIGRGQMLEDLSISVRFPVGSVTKQIRYGDHSAWYLCPSENPSELGVGVLKVWISPAVEKALKEQGVTDLETHFAGKTVSVSGEVQSNPNPGPILYDKPTPSRPRINSPKAWAHSMELETLDQLTVIESASEEEDLGGKRLNTPTVLAALRGRWQGLAHEEGTEFKQTLVFSGGALGQWFERAGTHPISITYYVEGTELVLQFNHEPERAFHYRMKQLRFRYKLTDDTLSLTPVEGGSTVQLTRVRNTKKDASPFGAPATGEPAMFGGPASARGSASSINRPKRVGDPDRVRIIKRPQGLTAMAAQFNREMHAADLDSPQPPLTAEELQCFALWNLDTDSSLSPEARELFTSMGIGRWLPTDEWRLDGGERTFKGKRGDVKVYEIDLVNRHSNTRINVRRRYLLPPTNFQASVTGFDDDTSMPLEAAIKEFNRLHNQVAGQRQPTLKLNEVLAAIVYLTNQRHDHAVDNNTFTNFCQILQTHELPVNSKLELLSDFGSSEGDRFRIWSVRLVMPQVAKPGRTYGLEIRKQYISVDTPNSDMIHWGKPNDKGLQAGFRLVPGQRRYQPDEIPTEFFYRSISGKPIPATLSNIFSHRKLIARDAAGNDLPVVEVTNKTIGGGVETTIGDEPTKKRGIPLDLGYITPDREWDRIEENPPATYVTVVDGHKCFLTYVVSDLDDGELKTGEVVFDIVGHRSGAANTPAMLKKLYGTWKLSDEKPQADENTPNIFVDKENLPHTLTLSEGAVGRWQESEKSEPISITYYLQGKLLLIRNKHNQRAFDDAARPTAFKYKISDDDPDSLWLTPAAGGATLKWTRQQSADESSN